MLGDCQVWPEIAVKDLATGKSFYCDTLGLKLLSENSEEMMLEAGSSSKLSVYKSTFAGTNQATYATFHADDVEGKVEALKAKGVTFEHYEGMPGVTLQGDVHVMGDLHAAWFKDPDGNILCVANMGKM